MAASTTEEQHSAFSAEKTDVERTSPSIDNKEHEKENEEAQTNEEGGVVYPTGITLILIITSLCMAVFLVALDQTIIAPALGAITAEFKSVKDIVNIPPKLAVHRTGAFANSSNYCRAGMVPPTY